MGSESEPAKLLLPYLQRADELQKHEHLVAYYCRLYAMERGMRIPTKDRTKTTNSLLISLMNQLEKDKKSLQLGPEDNLYVEGFSLNVFAKADKQDRAGRSDLSTAKTFYAASIFFEILNQFGELQPDLEQKQKYAAWKAADIRKALKEGRIPEPGPPGGNKDLSIPSDTPTSPYDLGPNESFPHSQSGVDISSRPVDKVNQQPSARGPTSVSSFSVADHPSNDFPHPPAPPATRPEDSAYPQPYHHQSYSQQPNESFPHIQPVDRPSRPVDKVNQQPSARSPTSASSFSAADHPSNDFPHPPPPPPPATIPENSAYPQPYHHQSYPHEQPKNYPSHESTPSYSYSNFQSYPSFNESSMPAVPGHHPSYYQGFDVSYTHQSGPPASNNQSTVQSHNLDLPGSNNPTTMQSNSGSGNGTHSEATPLSTTGFKYDCNYQPPPDKIAEAHKAARFAVGALAFDDVPVAVDFLKRSLELLTNPSASQ